MVKAHEEHFSTVAHFPEFAQQTKSKIDILFREFTSDLIGRMLTVDVESRITLPDIFQHEWLRQCQGSIEERVLEMKKMNLVSPAGISSVLSITDLIEMESKVMLALRGKSCVAEDT